MPVIVPPKPTSAICFDLGRVLIDFDWTPVYEAISQRTGLAPEEIEARLRQDPQLLQHETGKLSSIEFFVHLKKLLQFPGSARELNELWNSIFPQVPLEENLAIARSLAGAGWRLAMISNTNEAHLDHLTRNFDLFSPFQQLFFSCRLGSMKPSLAIYEAACQRLQVPAEETLLIDDLPHNLEGASAAGWQTLQYEPGADLRQLLFERGIRV